MRRFLLCLALPACEFFLPQVREQNLHVVCFEDVMDDQGTFTVTATEPCRSGSLVDYRLECEIAVEGDRILITTIARFREPSEQTDDCQQDVATCTYEDLPAGTWRITYGPENTTLVTGDGVTEPGPICLPADLIPNEAD